MKLHRFARKIALAGVATSAVVVLFSPAVLAQDGEAIEEVTVTGYRESLEAALNVKRSAVNSTESIVAEDIGKMPDLNLAESIQRVPGVAITREGGEGRQITVRGLGPDFTRVTLNGMEVPGSAGGIDSAGGVNRSRSIDFNIFASELFNRIDINKSQKASIEEGGLASTIELFTAKPFDNPGFHVSAGAQLTIDSLADENDPRYTALISNTFLDDTFGVLLSVAVSERTVRQEGFGTVRFSSADLQGDTWACGACPGTVVNGTFAAGETINTVFTPRLPRMDYFSNKVDRVGVTAAFQYRPTENLELGLDYVTSTLDNDRISYNYASQFRNLWDSITPLEITLDPSGQYMTAGSFTGVRQRSESRGQFSDTDFTQTVLSGSYDFSDSMTLDFMYGTAESKFDEEQDRFNIDSLPTAGNSFSFDMTQNSNVAAMSYGYDILDTSNYGIGGGLTIRQDVVERNNDTFRLDLSIIAGDGFDVRTGLITNTREVDSVRLDPVGLTAPSGNTPVDNFPGLAVTFQSQVGGGFASALDTPPGFPTDWMVEDFAVANALYNVGEFQRDELDSSTFNVEEETKGVYGEVNFDTELANMPLRLNAGLRYVETETTAVGAVDGGAGPIRVTATNSYNDVLPAVNAVLELQEDLLLRLNVSENITRPSLSDLVPAVSDITPINGNISLGNPDLDPIRSNSIDLGIEWYFADESLLAFTWFTKDIKGFIASDTVLGTLDPGIAAGVAQLPEYDPSDPLYVPGGVDPFTGIWNLEQPINAQDADLDGYEIIYQQPFTSLPGFWSNFGMIANYTHVESEALFDTSTGPKVSSLPGLSEESYNLTLYYETDVWGARVSTNSRDDYITAVSGSNGNAEEKNTGPTRVDVSAFYNVNDNVTVRLEVINLTEEEERNYTTGPRGILNLVREFNTTGREVYLGAKVDF